VVGHSSRITRHFFHSSFVFRHLYKLVILFKQPVDLADFERRWSEEFVPLVEQMPDVQRIVVSHTHGGPAGPVDIHLIHEVYFESLNTLKTAMASPQGVAAGQCLLRFAKKNATLLFAEHMEDVPMTNDQMTNEK